MGVVDKSFTKRLSDKTGLSKVGVVDRALTDSVLAWVNVGLSKVGVEDNAFIARVLACVSAGDSSVGVVLIVATVSKFA